MTPEARRQQAREHIAMLRHHGMPGAEIARRAQMQSMTVYNIVNHGAGLRPETLTRLLAVQPEQSPSDLIPADEASIRVKQLVRQGMSTTAIAAASGVSQAQVSKLGLGLGMRIRRATSDALMAVPLSSDPLARHRRADREDAAEVRDHLTALRGRGVSLRQMADHIGSHRAALSKLGLGHQRTVTRELAARILTYVGELGPGLPPPPTRVRPLGASLPWGETKRRAVALHQAGADVPKIAAILRIPVERVRDALATSRGPRTRLHTWPPAGHITPGRTKGRAA